MEPYEEQTDYATEGAIQEHLLKRALEQQKAKLDFNQKVMGINILPGFGGALNTGFERARGYAGEEGALSRMRQLGQQQQAEAQRLFQEYNTPTPDKVEQLPEGVAGPPQITSASPLDESKRRMNVGMRMSMLPMASKMGEAIIKSEADFPERMALQAEKATERKELLERTLEAKRVEAERYRLTAEQQREHQKALEEIQRQIAEARKAEIEAKGQAAKDKAAADEEKRRQGKELPTKIVEETGRTAEQHYNLKNLSASFQDEYAGGPPSTMERWLGLKAGGWAPEKIENMTNWWRDQAYFDTLPSRHATFGASLTAGEKQSWADATIHPGMDPKAIRDNINKRMDILERHRDRLGVIAKGYGAKAEEQVRGIYEDSYGITGRTSTYKPPDAPTTGGPAVGSAPDERAIAKGVAKDAKLVGIKILKNGKIGLEWSDGSKTVAE